jgi:hypothetical protein
MSRAAQANANAAANTAAGNAAQAGSQAAGNYASLNPFYTSEMNNPTGYSQQDLTSQLSSAEAGAGGATAGLTGAADLTAARTRNSGGFGTALDNAARTRQQALAQSSEGIAANNAQLKQTQQQAGAAGLAGLYGENLGQQNNMDKNQQAEQNISLQAGQQGWLQNGLAVANAGANVAKAASGFDFGGGGGQPPSVMNGAQNTLPSMSSLAPYNFGPNPLTGY